MPSFDTEIEFEVYCDTCGTGLCSDSTTTIGRTIGIRQVRVIACYNCMAKKDSEINDLKSEIESLEKVIEELNNRE